MKRLFHSSQVAELARITLVVEAASFGLDVVRVRVNIIERMRLLIVRYECGNNTEIAHIFGGNSVLFLVV
jgi:hypothetical protein